MGSTLALAALFVPVIGLHGTYLLFGATMMAVGLYWIVVGGLEWRRSRRLQDLPTSTVRSMAVGLVELEGTVRPTAGTIDAPLADDPCVHVEWSVDERVSTSNGHRWEQLSGGSRSLPFDLEDETGTVTVRPDLDEVEFDLTYPSNQGRLRVDRGEEPPEHVANFVAGDGDPAAGREARSEEAGGLSGVVATAVDVVTEDLEDTHIERRYRETALRVGSTVSVLGSAEPGDVGSIEETQADLLEVRRHDGIDEFLIADVPVEQLTDRYAGGPRRVAGGFFVGAIGLAFLVVGTFIPY